MIKALKPYLLFFLMLLYTSLVNGQALRINEVQYTNRTTLFDSYGDTPDWIEIINSGNVAVNLNGYMITDDSAETEFWTFPDYFLAADSVIVVFASGKNITEGNEWHTDFKLKVMKDPVFLLNPDSLVIDKIEVQCVPPDKSVGRFPDGSETIKILASTPSQTNNSANIFDINYQSGDSLYIDLQSGLYPNNLAIKLTNDNPENQIFYTLNADDPNNIALPYNEPISLTNINNTQNRFANKGDSEYEPGDLISKANIIRAQTFSEGCPSSNEIINTYFINEPAKLEYPVPVVSVVTDENNLFDDDIGIYVKGNSNNYYQHGKKWERFAGLEVFNNEGELILDQNVGIRVHGRASREIPQKSIRLYAREEYGKDVLNFPYFEQKPDIDKFEILLLRTTYGDWSNTLFKDELCQNITQDMNVDYVATQTVVLFINGEYWGVYSLRERHDHTYVENNYHVDSADIDVISYDKNQILVEAGTIDAYNNLISKLESYDAKSKAFYDYASDAFDLENLMNFFITQIYFANTDFPNNNFRLWKLREDTAKWRFFLFDFDAAFIMVGNDHIMHYNNESEYLQSFPAYSTFILRTLLANPRFRQEFNAQFFNHLNTTFAPVRVIKMIDEYEALYENLAYDHIYRWNKPTDYVKWLYNVDMLRMFAMQRPSVITGQLLSNYGNPFIVYPNPSNSLVNVRLFGSHSEVEIKLFNTNGQILYQGTYNGDDLITFQPKLTSGLYFLQVQLENGIYTEKLVFNN